MRLRKRASFIRALPRIRSFGVKDFVWGMRRRRSEERIADVDVAARLSACVVALRIGGCDVARVTNLVARRWDGWVHWEQQEARAPQLHAHVQTTC